MGCSNQWLIFHRVLLWAPLNCGPSFSSITLNTCSMKCRSMLTQYTRWPLSNIQHFAWNLLNVKQLKVWLQVWKASSRNIVSVVQNLSCGLQSTMAYPSRISSDRKSVTVKCQWTKNKNNPPHPNKHQVLFIQSRHVCWCPSWPIRGLHDPIK